MKRLDSLFFLCNFPNRRFCQSEQKYERKGVSFCESCYCEKSAECTNFYRFYLGTFVYFYLLTKTENGGIMVGLRLAQAESPIITHPAKNVNRQFIQNFCPLVPEIGTFLPIDTICQDGILYKKISLTKAKFVQFAQ
jgi:hypothetical protein